MVNVDGVGSLTRPIFVEGIDVLDLDQLPPVECQIARLLLRQGHLTEPLLREATASLEQRIAPAEFDSALASLIQHQVVISSADTPATYRLNLRRKRERQLGGNIWDRLGG